MAVNLLADRFANMLRPRGQFIATSIPEGAPRFDTSRSLTWDQKQRFRKPWRGTGAHTPSAICHVQLLQRALPTAPLQTVAREESYNNNNDNNITNSNTITNNNDNNTSNDDNDNDNNDNNNDNTRLL